MVFFSLLIRKKNRIIPKARTKEPKPKVGLKPNFSAMTPIHKPAKTSPVELERLLKDKRVALCSEGICWLNISKYIGSEKLCSACSKMKSIMAKKGLEVKVMINKLRKNPDFKIIRNVVWFLNFSESWVIRLTNKITIMDDRATIHPK